jgi:hypothetical protein
MELKWLIQGIPLQVQLLDFYMLTDDLLFLENVLGNVSADSSGYGKNSHRLRLPV